MSGVISIDVRGNRTTAVLSVKQAFICSRLQNTVLPFVCHLSREPKRMNGLAYVLFCFAFI